MARRRYSFDEKKIARFEKEGRGQGVGDDYHPWLTVQDVPSDGLATRVNGYKIRRQRHALSQLEAQLIRILDWEDHVLDIREQFPLPREATRKIAAEMGVNHPADSVTQTDLVVTTDMLVDVFLKQRRFQVAIAVKPTEELDRRTLEKLEIERRYWAERRIEWRLCTEKDIPVQRAENIWWAMANRDLSGRVVAYPNFWDDCVAAVEERLRVSSTSQTIARELEQLEKAAGWQVGAAMTALRFLIANKRIHIDLDQPLDSKGPIAQLHFNAMHQRGAVA
ncbi:TnsA endonuclease C terminal [Andreprevotia lacus DSM 23236]|jgi:hypothetical protein|uniref:TnsA endonuclease C terminal n=1 Tax=Andreprevotia lacus DSM 23236 TaxID=1121001 RepID=A0A1W1X2P1_9NEIS|nr:TnsA endonuclease N-terminal domain-containing protein [Andreprevotia lacus]SMC18167.1 TnsA endonuclease C terminal [Andreprevotia lacus DSM 23236]